MATAGGNPCYYYLMKVRSRLHTAILTGLLAVIGGTTAGAANVSIPSPAKPEGYLALLLLNEIPFPGERGFRSEQDSKLAMLSILLVLDSRINHIPPRYSRSQLAATASDDLMDIITAGGIRGQVDGFYRNEQGKPVAVSRVHERIAYLSNIANKGTPGRFARILNFAGELSGDYIHRRSGLSDRYAALKQVNRIKVTGRAYSWMTDHHSFHPGGTFVAIPNKDQGSRGGNRFFTLEEKR